MASTLETLAGTPTPSATADKVTSVHIIPYNANNDVNQPDLFLPYLWRRMVADDLVDYYFPGQKTTGFSNFVRMFSGDANVALVTVDSPSGQWDDTVAGFITWSTSAMGMVNVVIAGFIFFRKFWDHHTTDEAGALAFDYWFTGTDVEVVLGACPATHAVALRYNKRIGLKEIGRIPKAHVFKGVACDSVLVAITREEWSLRGRP